MSTRKQAAQRRKQANNPKFEACPTMRPICKLGTIAVDGATIRDQFYTLRKRGSCDIEGKKLTFTLDFESYHTEESVKNVQPMLYFVRQRRNDPRHNLWDVYLVRPAIEKHRDYYIVDTCGWDGRVLAKLTCKMQ